VGSAATSGLIDRAAFAVLLLSAETGQAPSLHERISCKILEASTVDRYPRRYSPITR
jgi:hypothetical protein